jgi:protein CWC15
MTSAHRPTFDHARGKESKVSSSITHKRALKSHSRLKFRNKKLKKNDEFEEEEEKEAENENSNKIGRKIEGLNEKSILQLKEKLMSNETKTEFQDQQKDEEKGNDGEEAEDYGESAEVKSTEDDNTEDDNTEDDNTEDENTEDEDTDDEEGLLREMELIKQEREEAKKRAEEKEIEKRAESSNPLISMKEIIDGETPKPTKKSWRSNKTMSKKSILSQSDRFSNDTLKSDFHKDFLDKYIR